MHTNHIHHVAAVHTAKHRGFSVFLHVLNEIAKDIGDFFSGGGIALQQRFMHSIVAKREQIGVDLLSIHCFKVYSHLHSDAFRLLNQHIQKDQNVRHRIDVLTDAQQRENRLESHLLLREQHHFVDSSQHLLVTARTPRDDRQIHENLLRDGGLSKERAEKQRVDEILDIEKPH